MTAFSIALAPTLKLTDEQFYQICQQNQELKFERNAQGDLIIMSPSGGGTGISNAGLTAQLWLWNERYKLGKIFDSSTGFTLPNGADRSPDAAWIPIAKWSSLTNEQQEKFIPICPDFVVELMLPSDSLKATQAKMLEYLANGAKLGWLINRKNRTVEIYRADRAVELLESPLTLSGELILPDFVLDLASIW